MALIGGATAPSKPSEGDERLLMPVIKQYLEDKLGHKPSDIKIIETSRQLVNGINHFVKVGHDGNVWHLRIHEALPCYGGNTEVHSHRVAEADEPLGYF